MIVGEFLPAEECDSESDLNPGQGRDSSRPPVDRMDEEMLDDDGQGSPQGRITSIQTLSNILVGGLAWTYFIQSGTENGIAPCSYTTFQDTFNSSATEVAIAVNMVEASKIMGSIVFGHFGHSHSKPLFVVLGLFLWSLGSIVIGGAVHIALLGLGFFLMGCGYSSTVVLSPAICSDLTHRLRHHDHRHSNAAHGEGSQQQTAFLAILYAGSAFGAAVGFVICGETVAYWRANFFVAPIFLVVSFFLIMGSYRKGVLRDHSAEGGEEPVHTPAQFIRSIIRSHKDSPPFLRTLGIIVKNPVIGPVIIAQTGVAFTTAAATQLIPMFVERKLQESKATASYVMAATVPAVCLGIGVGGWFCKRFRLTLSGQLLFNLLVLGASVPMMLLFSTDNLAVFVCCLVVAMISVFLSSAPLVTVLALAVEAQVAASSNSDELPKTSALVSNANGVASFLSRLLGAITGPIVLASLIDNSSPEGPLTFTAAYLIVGMGGIGLAALGALVAWWKGVDLEKAAKLAKRSPSRTK